MSTEEDRHERIDHFKTYLAKKIDEYNFKHEIPTTLILDLLFNFFSTLFMHYLKDKDLYVQGMTEMAKMFKKEFDKEGKR